MRKHQSVGLDLAVALLASLFLLGAEPVLSVVGNWQGSIETSAGNLKVVLHISAGKDDTFTATLDSPDQGAADIPINLIDYKQPKLHFEIERLSCSYDGVMSDDSSEITGLFKQGGGSASLSFKRVNK
jgi:hypothetical protein